MQWKWIIAGGLILVGVLVFQDQVAPEATEDLRNNELEAARSSPTTTDTTSETPSSTLTILRTASWEGDDSFHFASGDVTIFERPDGSRAIQFEDFDMRSGPDVYLFLATDVKGSNPEETGLRLSVPGQTDGRLNARGDFVVEIPETADLDSFVSLRAWCDQYNEPFGVAAWA